MSLIQDPGCPDDDPVERDLAGHLSTGRFDYIDFGCSKGGSLAYGKKALNGALGLGIDLNPAKVAHTRTAGFSACVADARQLSLHPNSVRFVTMIDFLEHLPSITDAKGCIEAACSAATDFVFIRQPWFDSDGYLFSLGLKLYWSDWTVHPNAMTTLEFHSIVSRVEGVKNWRLYGRNLIVRSADDAIHPISSLPDQHAWDPKSHGPKFHMHFSQKVFRQVVCVINKSEKDIYKEIEHKNQKCELIFDSEMTGVVGDA